MKSFASIKAIATYLPKKIEKNDLSNERTASRIGIIERHIAGADESAGDLAVAAAEKLFFQYGIERNDIDFLLLCTQHPDYPMPTAACIVQSRLGLPASCGAMDFNMGCSGYVYGLSLAKGMIEAGMVKNLLLLTSSVYTKFVNEKDRAIRPIFGDGATATLIELENTEKPFMHSFVFGTDGSRFKDIYIPVGGSRNMPRDNPEIFETDAHGNVRSNYEVHMDGNAVTYFTWNTVPQLVEDVLDKAKLQRENVDYYVFHQPNRFILTHLQKRCKLMERPFYNNIEYLGNTVAGTIPFALEDVLREKSPDELGNVMLAGFGVGLSWAGCIVSLEHVLQKIG